MSKPPCVLFIVGRPNWAHDFKTRNLIRLLGGEYDLRLRYQSEVTEEDIEEATLVVVYFWLQFEAMRPLAPVFRRNRHKLLVGICSSYELADDRRERGLEVIRDLAAGVFINNLLLYREFQPLLKSPIFYTPNGVDTRFYCPDPSKTPSSILRVGWAGSLTNQGPGHRGYLEFIVPAASTIEEVELLSAAREDKWRTPEEMRDFYRSLDVYLCASRSEGTPNPCLEAAACGVPLLTTRVGNMPEFVRDGINGFFVERDVEDIARKLRVLRDNPTLRTAMSRQIQIDIQAWDWSPRSRAYRQMFQEMAFEAEAHNRVSVARAKAPVEAVTDNSHFRVVALIAVYNEEDIIGPCLQHLINQGLEVYLIDNWSTDSTVELASEFLGKGLLAIEKFPPTGPRRHYHWKEIITRIEQLTDEIAADWFLFQDVDEIVVAPWSGLNLKEAIQRVDGEGFNCIDHTVINFYPTDNDFAPGADFGAYFKYFEFSDRPGQFVRNNAWKNLGQRINLAESGGHEARFEGRRPYPFRFLLKHYPVRSQEHGEKKIFSERKARWLPEERASGWHTHYDHIDQGYSFVRRPGDLKAFDLSAFPQISIDKGPSIIDWTSEHLKALSSQPAKALTLLKLELRKSAESVRALDFQLRKRKRGNATDGDYASQKNGLERKKVELERFKTELAEQETTIEALTDQIGSRQDAVELLATELTAAHKTLLTLFNSVAEPQQALRGPGVKAPAPPHAYDNVATTLSSRALAVYERIKQILSQRHGPG